MDDLEGTPPWLSFQSVIAFVSGPLTGGGHVCEESGNDVWDRFVEDLDTVPLSAWQRFSGETLPPRWTFRAPKIGKR